MNPPNVQGEAKPVKQQGSSTGSQDRQFGGHMKPWILWRFRGSLVFGSQVYAVIGKREIGTSGNTWDINTFTVSVTTRIIACLNMEIPK